MRVTSPSVEAIANTEIEAVQKNRVNIAIAPVAPNAIATINSARTAAASFRFALLFIFVSTFCVSLCTYWPEQFLRHAELLKPRHLPRMPLILREHFRLLPRNSFKVTRNSSALCLYKRFALRASFFTSTASLVLSPTNTPFIPIRTFSVSENGSSHRSPAGAGRNPARNSRGSASRTFTAARLRGDFPWTRPKPDPIRRMTKRS
jgi:hypothetical protein